MSYVLNVEFPSETALEEVQRWLDAITNAVPEDCVTGIHREQELVAAEDLTEDHIGSTVRFDQQYGVPIEGKLEAVFPYGTNRAGIVLVVNGTAYSLTYALVTVFN